MAISRQDRAKQFLPFDALSGFQDLLRKKEIEVEDRKFLTEETYAELDNEFNRVEIGTLIKVKYYHNQKYIEISGTVSDIDYNKKKIRLDEKYEVNVKDICYFEIIWFKKLNIKWDTPKGIP